MKRLLLFATMALLALGAIPLTAGATHAGGTPPKYEKANGTGESEQYGSIHVNADEQGDDLGHFFIQNGETEAQGEVTCLNVQDNRAAIGGIVEESDNPSAPPGSAVIIGVEDNDVSGGGSEEDRHFRSPPLTPGQEQQCNNPFTETAFAIAQPVVGNYIVHDFTP